MKSYRLGYLVLRLALGLNIFLHGVGRLGPGYDAFVTLTAAPFAQSILPFGLVIFAAKLIPLVECTVGVLLIPGFCTQIALLLGSALMMMLLCGVCMLQKWDLAELQMVYILFYAFLIYREEQDNGFSIDRRLRWRRILPEIAAETQ